MELDELEAHGRTLADMAWMHSRGEAERFTAEQLALTVQSFVEQLLAALKALQAEQQALAARVPPTEP